MKRGGENRRLIFLAGFLFIFGFAGFISAATPACAASITTDTVFDSNLTCSDTAITISAANVVLDCAGYTINYSTGGVASTYGIVTNQLNTTIKNCIIVDGNSSGGVNRHGIYFNGNDNSTLQNNSVTTSNSPAVYLASSANYNVLFNNTFASTSNPGVFIISSNYNNLTQNTISSASNLGLRVYAASNGTFVSNDCTAPANNAMIFDSNSNYNHIESNNATSTSAQALYIKSSNYNNLTLNRGMSTTSVGIYLTTSNYTNITSNIGISSSGSAIQLSLSNENTLIDNNGTSSSASGIYISTTSENNTLISNVGNSYGSQRGIRISSNWNTFLLNNGTSISGVGIDLSSSNYLNMTSNRGSSTSGYGIEVLSSHNNNFSYDIGSSGSSSGFFITGSNNNSFEGITAISDTGEAFYFWTSTGNNVSSSNVSGNYGYFFLSSNYTHVSDCISTNGTAYDVYLHPSFNYSVENVFVNCTYATESVNYPNSLLRKWYYDANVTYANGTVADSVNLTMVNSSGDIIFSTLTDSNGDISRYELIEYVNYGNFSYYDYVLNLSKTGLQNSTINYNFNNLKNVFDSIVYPIQFSITYPYPHLVLQRGANFTINGNVTGNIEGFSNINSLTVEYSGTSSGSYVFADFSNSSLNLSMPLGAGVYTLKIYDTDNPNVSKIIYPVYGGDIIVLMGQSNSGCTLDYADNNYSSGWSIFLYTPYVATGATYNSSTASRHSNLFSDSRCGPLAYNISSTENISVAMIDVAVGGSAIYSWQNLTSEDYYTLAMNHVRNYTGGTMNVKATYWYQGESDVVGTGYSLYYERLSNLTNNSLLDLNIVSGKAIIGQILKTTSDTASPINIRKAQQDTWYNHPNATRGPITYDILMGGSSEVHFDTTQNKLEFAERMMRSTMYSIYGVGENYPIVNGAYVINSTLLHINFSKSGLEISVWNESSNSSLAKGFNLTNDTSYIDDANIVSTNLSGTVLEVVFNRSISNMNNISICNDFSCYGQAIVRNSGDNLPMEIVYNLSLTISGEYVCSQQGKYWYSNACNDNPQSNSSSSSDSSLNSSSGAGTYKPSQTSLENGYTVTVVPGQNVLISFDGGLSEIVGVKSVNVEQDTILVVVRDEEYLVSVGIGTKVDLDNDGVYDVEISSDRIYSNGIAKLEFKLISEKVPSEEQEKQQEENIVDGVSSGEKIGFFRSIGNFFSRIWDWITFWN